MYTYIITGFREFIRTGRDGAYMQNINQRNEGMRPPGNLGTCNDSFKNNVKEIMLRILTELVWHRRMSGGRFT
jgi:hypothetical protein